MKRVCAKCGKPYERTGNTKYCKECAFLNRHKKCNMCGKIFVVPEGYIGQARSACFECDPIIKNGKAVNMMEQEIKNAKEAGMTYGHYQQWKYLQQCRTDKMIKKLNREINE